MTKRYDFQLEKSEELLDLLDDTTRFMLANMATVDSAPLQLYSSLLIFSPKGLPLRKQCLAGYQSRQI